MKITWRIWPGWIFLEIMTSKQTTVNSVPYPTQAQVSGGLSLIPAQTPLFCDAEKNSFTFWIFVSWTLKWFDFNYKIPCFPSALTFNDSNRKSQPHSYHVLQLKGNKDLPSTQPSSSHSSSSIPKCLPHHVIVLGNDTGKEIHCWPLMLYLKLVWNTSRMEKTQI